MSRAHDMTEQLAAHEESLAEVERLRAAMFKTYAIAANGGDLDALLSSIEAERDAYEAGYSVYRSRAAIAQMRSHGHD